MTTDSNHSLTPSGEEVQEHAPALGVQPQSSDDRTPEVASGNPVSTPGIASGNKPETINSNPAADTISAAPNPNKKDKDMNTNMHHNDKPALYSGENHNINNHGDKFSAVSYGNDGISVAFETTPEVVAGGVLLSRQPSTKGTYPVTGASFTIREGGANVTLRITVDDSGYLNVTDSNGTVVLFAAGGVDDWHLAKDENHWHSAQSAFLPAGTYNVAGEVTNVDMAPYNDENLLYCRYQITADYSAVPAPSSSSSSSSSYIKEVPICDRCGCGENLDGPEIPTVSVPGMEDEFCSVVALFEEDPEMPVAQTTTYEYNEQYRVSRINYHNGNYVEYAYDFEGRVTKETRPWGDGGKQMTRNVYAANSSRFYDTRPIKVYTDYEMADGTFLNLAVTDYTYEDTAEVERVTATTYAAGVGHQQVTIDETYGEAAEYPYAAGKPKFSQAVNGLQTWHGL